MKIAFFTEGQWEGQIPRNVINARSDVSWHASLNANHRCIFNITTTPQYDIGIIIVPKNNIADLINFNLVDRIRQSCDKVMIMQEGNHTYFQDYTLEEQIWYYNLLMDVDLILCHNEIDKKYYKGLTGKDVEILPVFMLEDNIFDLPIENRIGTMINGNFCQWYGAFDSYIIAQEIKEEIFAPSMGRKIKREEEMNITHLPYLQWTEWIKELNKRKYAVNCMRTFAAGTFSMNASYLGIPCIGWKPSDTQSKLHPKLTVDVGDMEAAMTLATLLGNEDFYTECAETTKENYHKYFSEEQFLKQFEKIVKKLR